VQHSRKWSLGNVRQLAIVYSPCVPATTYPGTVTPLRGLAAFSESERDVLFGRDHERDELAKLITGDGFRAGLLYGEPGVGKTSLLRAGLIPHLRDHGVIALPCDDLTNPAASFAAAAAQATGLAPVEGERPINFLARIVSQAIAGQLYLFILDDVDVILGRGEDSVITQLGDLFSRVVTRSGGRARFLFACCSSRVHRFGVLERRTGSLFPPSSRFELHRFSPAAAAQVLERTLALAGLPADRAVAGAVAEELGRGGSVLPGDLQIATLALSDFQIAGVDHLRAMGGASELERAWLGGVAASTGNERAGLRLLAEVASGDGTVPYSPSWAAARAGIDPEFADHAMRALQSRGVVYPVAVPNTAEPHYVLTHEILAPKVREIAAPARASARRAYELLGSKAQQGKRLSAMEWLAVRRERITPATPDEQAVLARTKRFFQIVAGVSAGIPLLLLIIIYVSKSGSYYLDVERGRDGRSERVVVRAGSSSLTSFDWLPASPSFGSIVADTGITRAMIAPDRWEAIADQDMSGDLDGDGYVDQVLGALSPDERAVLDYAATGDEVHLERFADGANGGASPDEQIARYEALRPIARGGLQETALVEQGLASDSIAVQTAALDVAVTTARRNPAAYREVLSRALTAETAELRHLAFSAVRGLGDDTAATLFQEALASGPGAAARAELLAAVTAEAGDALDAASTVSYLANSDLAPANRKRAQQLLRRAFATAPAEATSASVKLIGDHQAPEEHRLLAMALIDEHAPKESYAELGGALKLATQSKSEAIKIAAWPLFARANPGDAAIELVGLNERLDTLSTDMRVAVALGWGELARTNEPAARPSLEPLLEDSKTEVRAAAARAYGFAGRGAQNELYKMIKTERYEVAVGAAWGMANSIEVGGSSGTAIGGIAQLWKRKGKARRQATEIYARIAKTKPGPVYTYLASAARGKDDESLKPLGVRGLCNALAAGSGSAARALRSSANDSSTDVRRLVAECAVAHAGSQPKDVWRIASILAGDADPVIRADAARVLSELAGGKVGEPAANELIGLATDGNRSVRIIAVRGLAALGAGAPEPSAEALQSAFERADEGEKLELLAAARAVGAGDIVPMALADEAAAVRIAALDAAIGAGSNVGSAVNAALGDANPNVRRAALELLAGGDSGLGSAAISSALALATRDRDPNIADFAMETYARVGDAEEVQARLVRDLASPSERTRARAAAACTGLADRDAKAAVTLLEPILNDPARDVRVAMLPALAAAYAQTKKPEDIASLLKDSERHATRRLVAAAALVILDGGNGASRQTLEAVKKTGPPLARYTANIALGLIDGNTDGVRFLAELVR
jgi:hypothetical protein